MRVLHCLDNSNLGGIQQLILLFHQKSRHQHEFWAADGSMAPLMRAEGMKLWPGGPPEYNYDVAFGHGVGGWSYDNTFDMLHSHGVKCVEIMHSNHVSLTTPNKCDAFVSMNYITDKINAHMPNHTCIYPLIEWPEMLATGDKIGRLSRLVAEKKPQEFLEIARCFPKEKFVMAGDGQMREYLEAHKPPNLQMIGTVRDFGTFYNGLKMFVFPSQDECNSTSVAMAQAAGVPVICSDIPALRETTGGIAIFAKTVADFVARISEWLEAGDGLWDLGMSGRVWALGMYNTAKDWDEFINEVGKA